MSAAPLIAALAAVALLGPVDPASARTADPDAGAAVYERCIACHALEYDRTGPRHCGLFGRRSGSVPGFAYSEAMKRSGIVWTEATLDRFLAAPTRVVPGTTMGYAGISDPAERADLIAWLRRENASGRCDRAGAPK